MKRKIIKLLDFRSRKDWQRRAKSGPVTFRLTQKVQKQMMRQAPNYKDWLYKEMAEDFGVKMLEDGVFRIIEEPLLTPSGKLIGRRFHMEMDVYWAGYDVENE